MERNASVCCAVIQGRDYLLGQSRLRPCNVCVMSDTHTDTQLSHLVERWDRWTDTKHTLIQKSVSLGSKSLTVHFLSSMQLNAAL